MSNFIKRVYHSYWFPRMFYRKHDGGSQSGVRGYFLIEWKPLFSIGLLNFSEGSREAYHNHAFPAITFWIKGSVIEKKLNGSYSLFKGFPSRPKYTPRSNCHKVIGLENSWAFTIRGVWNKTWFEIRDEKKITLKHGREFVRQEDYIHE